MIDTDKYEGHTPTKEWGDIVFAEGYLSILLDDDVYATDSDRRLMADAPLLFEEVKRLRHVLEDIESMIPDNHEEVSPILSDILNECHRVLPMFNEVIE